MKFLRTLSYLLSIGLILFMSIAQVEAVNGYMSVDTFGILVVTLIAIVTAVIVFVIHRVKNHSREHQDNGANV